MAAFWRKLWQFHLIQWEVQIAHIIDDENSHDTRHQQGIEDGEGKRATYQTS